MPTKRIAGVSEQVKTAAREVRAKLAHKPTIEDVFIELQTRDEGASA